MAYQTFPWQEGDSNSIQKLRSLCLPDLHNKKVLDVGCNTGFFCGWALYNGAQSVTGIDNNAQFLAEAKSLFPECKFQHGDWLQLGNHKYDIILLLSAIHYAEDQQVLLRALMDHLEPGGTLILEIGIAKGKENDFVEIQRQIDKRKFPTWNKLRDMLSPYAYKIIGPGSAQRGDPVARYVLQITHKMPVAIMLIGMPWSGKSTLARNIFDKKLPVISGDKLIEDINAGRMSEKESSLFQLIQTNFSVHNDVCLLMNEICEDELLGEFVETIAKIAGKRDFIYDGYIPDKFQSKFLQFFHDKGFYVVDIKTSSRMLIRCEHQLLSADAIDNYFKFLTKRIGFDEDAYLKANPDVAEAVKEKKFRSGFQHYRFLGKREKRRLK